MLAAGQPRFNESGTLFEGIQIWGERKTSLTREDVQQRALAALKLMAQQGVLYVRTHVDVTEPRLIALDALLELREQVRDWMTVQSSPSRRMASTRARRMRVCWKRRCDGARTRSAASRTTS